MGIWNTETPGWVAGYAAGGNYPDINGNAEFEFGAGQNTHGKIAAFSLGNPDGHNLSAFRDAFVNTAIVTIADTDAPNLTPAIGPSHWANQVSNEPITVTARDLGLGVYRLRVSAENVPQSSGWPVQTMPCTGTTIYPCKGASTFTLTKHGEGSGEVRDYNPAVMPQGADNVLLTAEDPLGNKSETGKVKVWVDHSPPSLSLSGSATEQAKAGTNASQYTLKYSATDGDSASAAAITPFGTAGIGPGQIEDARGIATDASGNVWVVDRLNHRVMKYDSSGKFLLQFGSAGSGNGQFSDPRGIAVNQNGTVWVTDEGNNNVQAFSSTGQFIRNMASTSFADPYGVATGQGGVLWVSDVASHMLFEFNENGTFIRTATGTEQGPNKPAEMTTPSGLAVDTAGNVWISDWSANRVQEYNSNGEFVRQFSSVPGTSGHLETPISIAAAPSGNLLVTEEKNNRVVVFQPTGTYLRQFGSAGSGNAGLSAPKAIAVGPGNKAYVSDFGNHRVAVWSHADLDRQSGAASTEVKVDGQLVEPKYSPGCAAETCAINNREWTFKANQYSSGQHTVKVTATDAVGLSTTKEFTITTDATAPQLFPAKEFFSAPSGWLEQKSYTATALASDSGSGVNSLTIKIDEKVVSNVQQSCPNKGCSEMISPSINMATYKGGAHSAELIATDVAGNTAKKVWTINVDPKGTISGSEAIDTLEASDETAESTVVAPTDDVISLEEREGGNDPSLEQAGGGFVVTGVPTETVIPPDPTAPITIPTPEGPIQVDQLAAVGESPTAVANEAAAVTPNTNPNVDMINRPIYDGFLAFANIRSSEAPETYSWRVVMGKGQSLVQIDAQTAEVVYAEDGTSAAMIRAELAHDAIGKELSTSLTVQSPDVVTLTVHHKVTGVVYPVVGGPGFEVGYETVRAYIPPPPGEPGPGTPEFEFEGGTAVSPPEPVGAEDPEATASNAGATASGASKWVKRHFLHVECSHDHAFTEELGTWTEHCGNPFKGEDGISVAFRAAMHGKFFYKYQKEVRHEGGPNDSIGCAAEAESTLPPGPQRDAHVDRCVWWGATSGGNGGASATSGHHITPVGRFIGEDRANCGNECGQPNPWHQFPMPPMAFYVWPDGSAGFKETDCIDC